jgi:hypothetical protein
MAIVAGAGVGALIGSYVAANARSKGRMDLAIVAVLGCMIAGAIGGCLLALPLAWVLNSWIKGLPDQEREGYAGLTDEDYRRERSRGRRQDWDDDDRPPPVGAGGPFTELGTLVVCNRCRKATGKEKGQVPPECGHCGREFRPNIPKARRTRKPRPDPDDGIVELRPADDPPRRRR